MNPNLRLFPYASLRTQTIDVAEFDEPGSEGYLHGLVREMGQTMFDMDGVGLAAPQVSRAMRMFVMRDLQPEDDQPHAHVFVNPQIVQCGTESEVGPEGCLSIPGIHVPVERWLDIEFTAQDIYGEPFDGALSGMEARIFQHEHDHLEGVTLFDHVEPGNLRFVIAHYRLWLANNEMSAAWPEPSWDAYNASRSIASTAMGRAAI